MTCFSTLETQKKFFNIQFVLVKVSPEQFDMDLVEKSHQLLIENLEVQPDIATNVEAVTKNINGDGIGFIEKTLTLVTKSNRYFCEKNITHIQSTFNKKDFEFKKRIFLGPAFS